MANDQQRRHEFNDLASGKGSPFDPYNEYNPLPDISKFDRDEVINDLSRMAEVCEGEGQGRDGDFQNILGYIFALETRIEELESSE